jgi:hypothetical protein
MSFPTLSAPIPEYSTVHTYEQGELSLNTLGEVQSFFSDQDGNEQWSTLSGTGFANERDRILLPSRFTYTFPKNSTGTGATEAEFRLLDLNDNEVQTLVTTVPEYGKVNLNFNGTSVEPLKRYRLEVDSLRMRSTHEVAFFEAEQGSLNYWGFVLLVPRVQSEEFNLIDDDGFIRLRKNPDGTESKPEFFEIRIKSRPTFWRYANEHGRKIKTNASLDDYLIHDDENGVMTSLQMRYASVSPKVFSGNGNTRHLPQPLSYSDLRLETNRIVTEIRVPRSDLFDV